MRRKTLLADLGKLKEVYNAAWQANWGFVPMTDPEINFMADRLKPLLQEGLILAGRIARRAGRISCSPCRNYNQALKPLKGHLLTPKLFGFLPYLLGLEHPTACRVITLGVKEKYRGKGLESVLLTEGFRTGIQIGLTTAEASWILEDNEMMRRVIRLLAAICTSAIGFINGSCDPFPGVLSQGCLETGGVRLSHVRTGRFKAEKSQLPTGSKITAVSTPATTSTT